MGLGNERVPKLRFAIGCGYVLCGCGSVRLPISKSRLRLPQIVGYLVGYRLFDFLCNSIYFEQEISFFVLYSCTCINNEKSEVVSSFWNPNLVYNRKNLRLGLWLKFWFQQKYFAETKIENQFWYQIWYQFRFWYRLKQKFWFWLFS